MAKKRRFTTCETEQHSQRSLSQGSPNCAQSCGASQPTQPHGSSQTTHLPRASQPHHLPGTSRPSSSRSFSQPHEAEEDFDEAKTAAQVVATAPPTVNREHFADLVSYWFSDEGKALSLKNKGERNWNEDPHTTGSKSYARHAHELEEDSGFAPSRAQLYITTHTDKDENAVNDIAAANIAKIKELLPNSLEGNSKGSIYWSPNDIYSQAINKKEWSGRVRGCGFGPTPKSSRSTCNEFLRFNVADEEERMRDKQTIHELQGKVQSQAAELSTLKEQMAIVMRHAGLQVRDSCNGSLDQISPQAHQGSSHASYDIEYSD